MSVKERRAWLAALVAVIGLCATAVAAAIPDTAGVIHTCYQQGSPNGFMRPVESPTECDPGKGEAALSFNQQGPAGRAGAAGPAGPAGPPGLGAGGLELRYWAEVALIDEARLAMVRSSAGVTYGYRIQYGLSHFTFDRSVRDCIPFATYSHRTGRATSQIDRDHSPFLGNDGSALLPTLAVHQREDARELIVVARTPYFHTTETGRGPFVVTAGQTLVGSMVSVAPFTLAVFCYPDALQPPPEEVRVQEPRPLPFPRARGQLPLRELILGKGDKEGKPSKSWKRLPRVP